MAGWRVGASSATNDIGLVERARKSSYCASSFAMLSVRHLLRADSYLAKVQAKGYTVEAPL